MLSATPSLFHIYVATDVIIAPGSGGLDLGQNSEGKTEILKEFEVKKY